MARLVKRFLSLALCLGFLFAPDIRAQAATESDAATPRPSWLYFEAPVWDIADEGLPFRFTLALPAERDVIACTLLASEARWTFSAGYAKVYNSFDGATGIFKNPGGHAALFSLGKQYYWQLPSARSAWIPRLTIEVGLNLATRRFPADGEHASIKAIAGFEWSWHAKDRETQWSAAIIWPHFSNANLLPRNAGYDGISLRLGRSWRF